MSLNRVKWILGYLPLARMMVTYESISLPDAYDGAVVVVGAVGRARERAEEDLLAPRRRPVARVVDVVTTPLHQTASEGKRHTRQCFYYYYFLLIFLRVGYGVTTPLHQTVSKGERRAQTSVALASSDGGSSVPCQWPITQGSQRPQAPSRMRFYYTGLRHPHRSDPVKPDLVVTEISEMRGEAWSMSNLTPLSVYF
jgi:hypothetical protein